MKRHIKKIICVFFGALILIFFVKMKFTYSKYSKSDNTIVSSDVAKPILIFDGESEMNIECLNSNKYSYEFSIKNFDGNFISDINFRYYIFFELSQENAPILINLYKKSNGIEEKLELKNNKIINLETLDIIKNQNDYRAEILYDTSSKEIMSDNLKIKVLVQAVQEEEVIEETIK